MLRPGTSAVVKAHGLPSEIERFVAETIDSVHTLEILLFLRACRDRAWTADQVHHEVKSSTAAAVNALEHLTRCGILHVVAGHPPSYRFHPESARLERSVTLLAETYAERRTALISALYARRG